MTYLLIRFSQRLNEVGAILAALVIASMCALILYEIALRAFFSSSTYVLDEMVGYGVAASTFLGLGYTLQKGALIRVNLVISMIHHRLARRLLELTCVLLVICINVLVLQSFWKSITRNYHRGAVSETVAQVPLWIPEGILFLGLVFFTLQLGAYLLIILSNQPLIGETESLPIQEQEG